ncbi:MAG: hypothetical protein GY856_02835 [bacterium]|nr:hypothetical protein [bacterium]
MRLCCQDIAAPAALNLVLALAFIVGAAPADASGKVLAEFRHKRLIVMGAGGGDYIPKMRADCRRLGEDIAKFLDAWVKGKNLRKG